MRQRAARRPPGASKTPAVGPWRHSATWATSSRPLPQPSRRHAPACDRSRSRTRAARRPAAAHAPERGMAQPAPSLRLDVVGGAPGKSPVPSRTSSVRVSASDPACRGGGFDIGDGSKSAGIPSCRRCRIRIARAEQPCPRRVGLTADDALELSSDALEKLPPVENLSVKFLLGRH
jgi:hypothetical protein